MNKKLLWNEGWSFLKTPAGTGFDQAKAREQEFMPVDIPHDWLIYDALNLYEDSTGWYRKSFHYEEDRSKRAFLIFEGIYMDSTVYINGDRAGEWKYGYSTFDLEITDHLKQGENEIMVSACFLSPNSRWYSGAGIYRNVWFKVTERTYLPENAVYINTRMQKAGEFLLCLAGEIKGEEEGKARLSFRLFDEKGQTVDMEPIAISENKGKYLVKNVKLWDVEAPILYTLKTQLILDGELTGQQEEKFGFRYTEFSADHGFFLNGRHLKLNGVCEHHDLGALGAAFNRSAMRRKFRILKEMGVNAVRGSHNMMAPGFVELADEMGILLISEAFDMWERPKTTYDYARFFKDWSAKDVESWVKRDRNHPSVIMWSIGNEIYDTHADERGMEITVYLKKLVEKYDAGMNARVTMGSNYMPWENAQKCADIVKAAGYNYSEKYYLEHHEKHPDWIIYGSETSSIVQSRGVYHFPLKAGILAEEDEQCSALGNSAVSWGARSMEECAVRDRDMEFSMGQFIWTGFDYIGEPTPYHTKNAYFGQSDTAGFKKDSYYVWQSVWTDYKKAPMVHVFPYWDFNEGQLIDVRVCSNGPFVELFLNGRSLGRQELTHEKGSGSHIIADYQVPYEKGVLAAVAYDEMGKEIAREEKRSFGNSDEIVITPENTRLYADGRDLLFLEIGTIDKEGNRVENACDRVRVRVTGAGRLIGLDNGDSTDYDSYKGISRRLFNGKLLAIIQADTKPGKIQAEVTGKGLKGAAFVCESIPAENIEASIEESRERQIILGSEDEIPVRKVTLRTLDGQLFTKDKDVITVEALIEPPSATDRELVFKAVNDTGVSVRAVDLMQEGNRVTMKAKGDGSFRLFALSKSGSDKVRVMSQLEFCIEGLGQAYLDPYDFISGSLYTSFKGEVGNGNEKGVATARDGETVVSFSNLDFGNVGSDEITIPIFALSSEEYPIQIWEGIPGEEDCELLAEVVYQKPSVWNTYQPDTYKLGKRLKGITTISFLLRQKVHIKGFSFTRYEKAWLLHQAKEADAVYGDSFVRTENAVEKIGNNVSFVFTEMDFAAKGARELAIKGRTGKKGDTIHVRFFNGTEEIKQIVEFPGSEEYSLLHFKLEPVRGKWDVTFVFLPGSSFDFESFQFS
ncbi:MAG: glycoside hydrolase family 2 protein [Lachnospiraceae bacterium]|nr:glycoside hydrolase family 2 protein [Lachnospiraceae bacterium]